MAIVSVLTGLQHHSASYAGTSIWPYLCAAGCFQLCVCAVSSRVHSLNADRGCRCSCVVFRLPGGHALQEANRCRPSSGGPGEALVNRPADYEPCVATSFHCTQRVQCGLGAADSNSFSGAASSHASMAASKFAGNRIGLTLGLQTSFFGTRETATIAAVQQSHALHAREAGVASSHKPTNGDAAETPIVTTIYTAASSDPGIVAAHVVSTAHANAPQSLHVSAVSALHPAILSLSAVPSKADITAPVTVHSVGILTENISGLAPNERATVSPCVTAAIPINSPIIVPIRVVPRDVQGARPLAHCRGRQLLAKLKVFGEIFRKTLQAVALAAIPVILGTLTLYEYALCIDRLSIAFIVPDGLG